MYKKEGINFREKKGPRTPPQGLYYDRSYLKPNVRHEILEYLKTVHPIWELRYSKANPPPLGKEQRALLRPVYWLGNWQFACLNYYHPPKGILNRCVTAEPFPPVLAKIVAHSEKLVRAKFSKKDIPPNWELNTCLINLYGDKRQGEKWVDAARVGDHKDFEPGPVASLSMGERAMFQFTSSSGWNTPNRVVFQQWLDDGSLQIFGGSKWKDQLFHRVQRVDKKQKIFFPLAVEGFKTRRINFTFRYVPRQHFVRYGQLPVPLQIDVKEYVEELAKHSKFFRSELK